MLFEVDGSLCKAVDNPALEATVSSCLARVSLPSNAPLQRESSSGFGFNSSRRKIGRLPAYAISAGNPFLLLGITALSALEGTTKGKFWQKIYDTKNTTGLSNR